MYDIIGYFIYSLLVIIGILFATLPGERLIDEERLRPNQKYDRVLKRKRILGALVILFGIVLIIMKAMNI